MGRSFLLRPLEKRVNGEIDSPRIGSLRIKHTHWKHEYQRSDFGERSRNGRSERVRSRAASKMVSTSHSSIEKVEGWCHERSHIVMRKQAVLSVHRWRCVERTWEWSSRSHGAVPRMLRSEYTVVPPLCPLSTRESE